MFRHFTPRSTAQLLPRLAFIDVETTGANPVVDRITEIAILRVENGVLVERWSSLVNPGMAIPPSAMTLPTASFSTAAKDWPGASEPLPGAVFSSTRARLA